MESFKKWAPVILLLVTISGQWLVIFTTLLSIEQRITRVETMLADRYKAKFPRTIEAGDLEARIAMRKTLRTISNKCAEETDRALSSH